MASFRKTRTKNWNRNDKLLLNIFLIENNAIQIFIAKIKLTNFLFVIFLMIFIWGGYFENSSSKRFCGRRGRNKRMALQ